MEKSRHVKTKTPLEYYEIAILEVNKAKEELQEEIEHIKSFKSGYENLVTELQEAKKEIDRLKEQLQSNQADRSNLENLVKKTTDNERNTNYLYQNIQELKRDLEKTKENKPQGNNDNLRQEILALKKELLSEREKANQSEKRIEKLRKDIFANRILHYRKLERYLITKRWDKADLETLVKVQELVGKVGYSSLHKEDLDRLSGDELHFIDQLWLKHSRGHFGLSVQKRIYQSVGGETNIDPNIWKKFGKQVGWYRNHHWIRYNHTQFSLDAPCGHLPARIWDAWNNVGVGSLNSLMSVLLCCESW